jgi:hypothetical protein
MPQTRPVPLQHKTLLQWTHGGRDSAHCLARLILPPAGRPVAVVSELRSNPDRFGVSDDFARVAEAFLEAMRPVAPVEPADVRWVAHHGAFSYHDSAGAEDSFTAIDLCWDGHHYHDDPARHRLMSAEETTEVLAGVELEPVPVALDELRMS